MAEVHVFTDPSGPTRWHLEGPRMVIGRDTAVDIVLDDPLASRQHAVIVAGPGGVFTVEDLGSKNGILVNGTKVPSKMLVDGDLIRVGRTDMKFIDDIPAFVPQPRKNSDVVPVARPARTPREPMPTSIESPVVLSPTTKAATLVHDEGQPRTTATHRIGVLEDSLRAKDAEIAVLRQALKRRGLDPSSDAPSSGSSLLGDGLLELVSHPQIELGGPVLAGTSARRPHRRPLPTMSFLGVGPSGDRFIAAINDLGQRLAVAVVEALVPAERIAVSREHLRTIAEGGVSQSIGREIEPLAESLGFLRGAPLAPVTDFFIVGDLESFGDGADAYLEVDRVLDVVFPDLTQRPRVHAIIFGRAWRTDSEVPAEWRGWQSLLLSRRIASVLVCDRDRGFGSGGAEAAAIVPKTVAGVLESLWRTSHFPAAAGQWNSTSFSETLGAGGFSTLAVIRSEGTADKLLEKVRATVFPGGLAWPGAPTAFARALSAVWMVEREAFADVTFGDRLAEQTARDFAKLSPQARIQAAVLPALSPGALLVVWVGGVHR